MYHCYPLDCDVPIKSLHTNHILSQSDWPLNIKFLPNVMFSRALYTPCCCANSVIIAYSWLGR